MCNFGQAKSESAQVAWDVWERRATEVTPTPTVTPSLSCCSTRTALSSLAQSLDFHTESVTEGRRQGGAAGFRGRLREIQESRHFARHFCLSLHLCLCLWGRELCVCACSGIPQGCFNFTSVYTTILSGLPEWVCVCQCLGELLKNFPSLWAATFPLPSECVWVCQGKQEAVDSVMWQHYLLDCFILRKRCLWLDTTHTHLHSNCTFAEGKIYNLHIFFGLKRESYN